MPKRFVPPLLAVVSLLTPLRAAGDAIVVTRAATASTIAEIFVEESAVRVEVEIGLSDLPAFRNLLPDGLYQRLGHEPEPLASRQARFFGEDLVIRADQGPPLAGRVREMGPRLRVPRDEITGEPLPGRDEEGETVVFAVLEYPFQGRPASLAFRPPAAERGAAAANIGFVAYHLGLPVNDFRYFGVEAVLDLDWEDSWYSRFRGRNLRRRYQAPIHAFLYVEPYEVRAEIIARPRDLQAWVDLGLDGRRTIPVEAQPELKRRAAEFLAVHVDVTVDGERIEPTLDRIHFLRRTLRSSSVIDPPEELEVLSATLGVIFVFPAVALPDEATLTWDLFSERIPVVPAAATDEAGPLPYQLVPDDNVLRWQNFLKNPTLPTLVELEPPPVLPVRVLAATGWLGVAAAALLGLRLGLVARRGHRPARRVAVPAAALLVASTAALLLARSGEVGDERAREILGGLLHNVYRAFDFREEGTIYDVLERSVTGELLSEIYLETRRGLELASQGGARAKVKEVALVEVDAGPLDRREGFLARCTWNVRGSVGHWGHVHQRTNQYEAELSVEPVEGAWKITGLELLQEQRL
jgi:hypothetical protein